MSQPVEREVCDHFWVSIHEPDHLLYWVKVCSLCRQPDWDDLDSAIENVLDGRIMEYGGPQEVSNPVSREDWGSGQNITPKVVPASTEYDPMVFLNRARMLVYVYAKNHFDKTDTVIFGPENVYVVSFAKVLGNWKALVSTTLPDGMYYEVTHDGQACYDYVDAYKKVSNRAVPEGIDSYSGVLEFLG